MAEQALIDLIARLATLEREFERTKVIEYPAGASGITGSGAANQIAFFTGASSIGGDTALTFDPTTDQLSIIGNSLTPILKTTSATGLTYWAMQDSAGSTRGSFGFDATNDRLFLGNSSNTVLTISQANHINLPVGNLGIGVTVPTYKLDILAGASQGVKIAGSGATPATMYLGQDSSAGDFQWRTNLPLGSATVDDAALPQWAMRMGSSDDWAIFRSPPGAAPAFLQYIGLNSTGQLLIRDGSVSSPSYAFIADTNTGFYRFGADQVALSLGGYDSLVTAQSAFKFRRGDSNNQFDGAQFVFYRSHAAVGAVANGDVIFDIAGNAQLAAGEAQVGLIRFSIPDASASYDTQWDFYASINSVLTNTFSVIGSGVNITGSLQADSIVNDTGLAAGVYTPTRSAETNLDANVTPTEAQYMRVGNTVTVSGRVTGVDPTLAATATSFELSLPVASNIGAVEDLAGTAVCGAIAGQSAEVTGSVANNTAVISWRSTDITSQSWSYTFTYQVI